MLPTCKCSRILHSWACSRADVPHCCLDLNWLFPLASGEHRSTQTRTEHEYACRSLETWKLEVRAKCLDEMMSQDAGRRLGQPVGSALEHQTPAPSTATGGKSIMNWPTSLRGLFSCSCPTVSSALVRLNCTWFLEHGFHQLCPDVPSDGEALPPNQS